MIYYCSICGKDSNDEAVRDCRDGNVNQKRNEIIKESSETNKKSHKLYNKDQQDPEKKK